MASEKWVSDICESYCCDDRDREHAKKKNKKQSAVAIGRLRTKKKKEKEKTRLHMSKYGSRTALSSMSGVRRGRRAHVQSGTACIRVNAGIN